MNRRQLLRALGLTAGGLTSGALTRGSWTAHAQEAGPYKRLLVVSHCHGWTHETWRLQPSGLDRSTPWEVDLTQLTPDDLSAPLRPLHAHRARMLPIDGLSLLTAELDTDGNRHDRGWIHAWTGGRADFAGADTRASGPSLDQIVAAQIARPDRLPSLELSIDDRGEAGRPLAYAPHGVRLPALNTPDAAWRRLFGSAGADADLSASRKRVLDYADNAYLSIRPSLASLARDRLDAHFELLRATRERILGMASLTCEAPEPPAVNTYDERFDAFSDLIASAFACDVTRVVTLSLGELPTDDFGWGDVTDDVHKGLAHDIYLDPQKHEAMTDYLVHHSQQMARLLDRLEATPDPQGGSLMDHTLIVWGSELADGWHGYRHYCPTLFGGAWAFRPGRYVHLPHTTPARLLVPASAGIGGYSDTSGRPHQHLLVSVAQAMGVDIDQVGLGHVQGQDGDHIDCTGPLQELS